MTGGIDTPRRGAADQADGERGLSEKQKERGVFLWAFFLIFGTHIFAGFVWLLFYVGRHHR